MEWITCESIYEESWRRLMELANIELAVNQIERLHGAADDLKTKKNYQKQAEQIRGSLLQAKEYFEAARVASLYTQPNLFYYGMVSLSTACMLLRGSGEMSLDFLRKNKGNSQHGLNFTCSLTASNSRSGLELLEKCFVSISPNGHFKNWYSILKKNQAMLAKHHYKFEDSVAYEIKEFCAVEIPDFSEILNKNHPLIYFVKYLPDLQLELDRYSVDMESARGDIAIYRDMSNGKSNAVFNIDGVPSEDAFKKILGAFYSSNIKNISFKVRDKERAAVVILKDLYSANLNFSFPYPRETLDHYIYFFPDFHYRLEIVDLFLIGYALSMLSRYYPDLWVSFLDSHCKGARIVERIVRLLMIKSPLLMLNQMYSECIVISNHKPLSDLSRLHRG